MKKNLPKSLVFDVAEGRALFSHAASTLDHFLIAEFVLSQCTFRFYSQLTVFACSGYVECSVSAYDAVLILQKFTSFHEVIVDFTELLITTIFIEAEEEDRRFLRYFLRLDLLYDGDGLLVGVCLDGGLLFEGGGLQDGQFDQIFLVLSGGFVTGKQPFGLEFGFWGFEVEMIIALLIVLEVVLEKFEDVVSVSEIILIPGSEVLVLVQSRPTRLLQGIQSHQYKSVKQFDVLQQQKLFALLIYLKHRPDYLFSLDCTSRCHAHKGTN